MEWDNSSLANSGDSFILSHTRSAHPICMYEFLVHTCTVCTPASAVTHEVHDKTLTVLPQHPLQWPAQRLREREGWRAGALRCLHATPFPSLHLPSVHLYLHWPATPGVQQVWLPPSCTPQPAGRQHGVCVTHTRQEQWLLQGWEPPAEVPRQNHGSARPASSASLPTWPQARFPTT